MIARGFSIKLWDGLLYLSREEGEKKGCASGNHGQPNPSIAIGAGVDQAVIEHE